MQGSDTTSSDSLDDAEPADVQATFCATLVDQWIALGVRHAVVAPGSRSTPMALAMAARDELAIHVFHDERVASFAALGLGLRESSNEPAVPALLLCTSGTAAANFLPAVVEAGLSEIPMIVLTADRPEELRGVGAPQTIDQIELYGSHVRWFHDPGVAHASEAGGWRQLASMMWLKSSDGPVHLNLPFREPLVGSAFELPVEITTIAAPTTTAPTEPVPAGFGVERGVILVGGLPGIDLDQVLELQTQTGWPIIADPISGLRHASTVTTIDALLRDPEFADAWMPDVIVRVGRPSTSKLLSQWTTRAGVTLVQVGGPGSIDPGRNVAAVCSICDLLAADHLTRDGSTWLASWREHERVANAAIVSWLDSAASLTEPDVARTLAEHAATDSVVTVSSSMPVRDLEWFGGLAAGAHSNRGANGIDGVMSTAVGRALSRGSMSTPNYVLIGDLAFVHDSNALIGLNRRSVDLRIVVVDNDGGGIFSFLSQASLLEHDRFEQLFGTPLGTDVLSLAGAHGVATATATTRAELIEQLSQPGPWVCRVPSDRAKNVEAHRAIHAAVSAATGG
jgi:2-succinyl-5-enolpyruvyl-6-hydroxy-3-cyclohexene-1-carboxylate synthase